MATHSSILAWRIPGAEEPGGLPSMESHRVGHELKQLSMHAWRRKWQPTPMFLPGESQGRQSLVGCRLWGRTESDTTEVTQQQHMIFQVSQMAQVVKNPSANAGVAGAAILIPGSGRSPGVVNGNPLQCSCLENSMERGASWAAVHEVTKSQT